jgi:hypothetical protein
MGNTTLPHRGAPQCGPRYRSLKRSCLIVTAWLLIAQTPRYLSCRCCGHSSHIVNSGTSDYASEILDGVNQQITFLRIGRSYNVLNVRYPVGPADSSWRDRKIMEGETIWPEGDPVLLSGVHTRKSPTPALRVQRTKRVPCPTRRACQVGEEKCKRSESMLPRPPPPPKEMPRGVVASWLKAALTRWALGQTLQEDGSREAVREVDGGGRRRAEAGGRSCREVVKLRFLIISVIIIVFFYCTCRGLATSANTRTFFSQW